MTSPWDGPRHRSWASDTVIFGIIFLILLIVTVTVGQLDAPAPPPAYLTGLLGAAGAALFGAAGSDKSKREADIADDARIAKERANTNQTRVDKLTEIARQDHPERPELHEPPMDDEGGGESS